MELLRRYNKIVIAVILLIFVAPNNIFAAETKNGNAVKELIKNSAKKQRFKQNRITNKAEVLTGTTVHVLPEVVTKVFLSNRDINRFTCGGNQPVKDVIFSTEKNITKTISNNNAYIKFLVGKEGNGKYKYNVEPSEFYILCGSEATNYTVIGIPKDIPAQHVILTAPSEKIKNNLSLFKSMSFEKIITKVMKQAYLGEFPDSYTIEQTNKIITSDIEDVSAVLKTTARIEGEGLNIKIFHLSIGNNSQKNIVNILDQQFIKQNFSKNPIAIALEYQTIKKDRITRLFILEQPESKNS